MSPFLLMSIMDYSFPFVYDLSMRTSVLFYIHGAINQLIALIMGGSAFMINRKNFV